ncbi:MAG: tRNA (guanosine(37)-N1)-methyltransferase TrmD [Patescibacteria group bacterium]
MKKKLRFDIITIFPKAFDSYLNESIIKRAQKQKNIEVRIHNLRDFTNDRHKTVDDRPFGGGAGMVLKIEPIYKALKKICLKNKKSAVVLLSAKGKLFTQQKAREFSKLEQIILICGHYEGVDERVAKYLADEEISIGQYVLTGGELPALTILDATTRLLPGVIKEKSLEEESFSKTNQIEYPQYTRPEKFKVGKKNICVPKVLLSGNHKNIQEWHKKHQK